MKTSALRRLRARLAAREPVYGLWVTLESPSVTEMAVALGLDWVVIDAEHGHLDFKEIVEHVRAAVRSDTVVLVRIAELGVGVIKRVLDLGADGVVVPWVESADQLRQAVAFAHYPPEGLRGIGAERATCWGQCFAEHTREANENVLVVPIIESVRGGENLRAMLEVDGVEVFFFGPADFSSSAGHRGQWEGPGVAERIGALKDAILAAGKHCGVMATGHANLLERRGQGFGMLGLGADAGLLLRGLHESLAAVGRDRRITASFAPECEPSASAVMERPPESMRPDRDEVVTAVGQGPAIEIGPGVRFDGLVGSFNRARGITTGLVTLAPGAQLACHLHPYAESVTLLSGSLLMEVEGRRYALQPLDTLTVPAERAHVAQNPASREPAVLHVAMASDSPTRTLVHRFFSRRTMPPDCPGVEGGERIVRIATAPRSSPGSGADFVDYFNRDLVGGLTMSGGYGLFQPGGRLPAHVHDFDESICIVQGRATCVVEGRRYTLTDCATAMQPRGRVHYFVNESDEPMAMIWVYAGPRPERLVVSERCATLEGSPWRNGEKART